MLSNHKFLTKNVLSVELKGYDSFEIESIEVSSIPFQKPADFDKLSRNLFSIYKWLQKTQISKCNGELQDGINFTISIWGAEYASLIKIWESLFGHNHHTSCIPIKTFIYHLTVFNYRYGLEFIDWRAHSASPCRISKFQIWLRGEYVIERNIKFIS